MGSMDSAAEIWKKVLTLMEGDLTATTLSTWFDDAQAVAFESDRLVLYTPNNFKRDIIPPRYVPAIQKALRELFSADFEVKVLEQEPVEYRCGCSRDRIERALLSLGRDELSAILAEQGSCDLTCQFCDRGYHFSGPELEGLIQSLEKKD